ncbi:maleylpyruvate isomerase N-terminal domain-containing protein [Saccharopolyspora sp. MS10]|uniref:maleylpyruvate isomerase N-terminal domain-containing protein n=1 Tax=Saccharopolyspora sp. MS10 TaxID=3385973 RepID=UPI0039A00120
MIVNALDQAWQAWIDLGQRLEPDQWERPTRLAGWTVRHVFAHHADVPAMIGEALDAGPEPDGAATFADAAQLLAFLQRPGGIAEAAAGQIREAGVADERTGPQLVERLAAAPRTVARLREQDLSGLVPYFGLGTVPAREVLRVQLMEAVVHYLDLAEALGLPRPGPVAGAPLRETAALLAAIADPMRLVEAATGRGGQVFPVLR